MHVKLSQSVYDKVTKIAKDLDMPRTQVINMLVNQYLKKEKTND